jgi:predicted DCC family thiol-disulfide oxidoreductase YuxK
VDHPTFAHDRCTVIYDGQCRFCVKSKERIERLSRSDKSASVRFIPYQSAEAEQVLGPDYRPGRPDVAYLIGIDGNVHQGLDAILPLLLGIRGGSLLMALLRMPVLKPVAHRLYRFIARNRYRWFGDVPLSPK